MNYLVRLKPAVRCFKLEEMIGYDVFQYNVTKCQPSLYFNILLANIILLFFPLLIPILNS